MSSIVCVSRLRSARAIRRPDARNRRLAPACLLGAIGCLVGCTLFRGPEAAQLPARHAVRAGMLQVRSDAEIADNDPRIAELHDLRREVRSTLQLPEQRRPVTVYLFRDEARYVRYMQARHPNLPSRRAFFIGTPAELAVFAFWGDQVREDLRHEYTHGLLHATLQHVPLWLDEGLAEFFEVSSASPGRINQEHVSGLTEMLLHGWRPNLRRMEQLDDVSEMQRADYQEAWAWVHFLLNESAASRDVLLAYLAELRTPAQPPSFAARLDAELPRSTDRLLSYITTTFAADVGRATASAEQQRPQSPHGDR